MISQEELGVAKELDRGRIIQLSYFAISQEHVKSIGKNWLILSLVLQVFAIILTQLPMVWIQMYQI
jgi:uncharacterized membrane protein